MIKNNKRVHLVPEISRINGKHTVQMGRWPQGDEELTAVRTWPRIGHRQCTLVLVPQTAHNLILKFASVDRRATTTSACGVSTLDHEARDDSMEDHVVVLA